MRPADDAPVIDWARWYVRNGLSVIPVRFGGKKSPALPKWEPFQDRPPTDAELAEWFAPGRPVGVAVVCGPVSDNLAVLDFEAGWVWERFAERVAGTPVGRLVAASPQVETPSGGRHVYCRLRDGSAKGTVLARRDHKTLLAEVRGEGNYVLAPGCPPDCHTARKPYRMLNDGWLASPSATSRISRPG